MQWWIAQVICVVLQISVPVFVMISGALLLDETRPIDSVERFYRKRFGRIAKPGIFWMTLYFFFRSHFDGEPVSFSYIVTHLIMVDPPYHTYYLLLVALLYLATPLLRVYIESTPVAQRHRHIAILFTLAALYSLFNALFWQRGRTLLTFFVPYLAYYLSGHELHTRSVKSVKPAYVVISIVVCILYIALHANVYIEHQGRLHGRFVLGMLSLPVILLSLAWFNRMTEFERPIHRLDWLVKKIAPTTFGIYLSHVAILIGLGRLMGGEPKESEFMASVALGTAVVFFLSFLFTALLRKLPLLKRLI